MTFQYLLEDFPEWAINYIKVIPIFYSETGINLDNEDINSNLNFHYLIQKIEDNFLLKVDVSGSITQNLDEIINLPLYVDVKLVILNENIYNTVQNSRGK